jgi:molybdenum ABC transporter molybdate-binding protein
MLREYAQHDNNRITSITRRYRILPLLLLALLASCDRKPAGPEVVLYCAAGVQPPVQEIIAAYEKETGVAVRVQYGGSGQLLGNIEASRRGDLFIAGDASYIDIGRKKGLIHEAIPLATMRPVILVATGNPKKIASLNDLLRNDVRLALANPDQASIGRTLRALLQKTGQWGAFEKHATVLKPTVNDLANDVKVGSVDAAIVWDATARQYPDLAAIHSDVLDAAVERVTIGVLADSSQPTRALQFARFLAAADRGGPVFTKHAFEAIGGDPWSATPTMVLYCGALNRVAVKDTITRFEQREGCRITTVYNGCGILVAQMKAGQHPDAYLACDVSFVPPVQELFSDPLNISEVAIVIAVPKGNPRNIAAPADLAREGIRLGLCHPEQSSIGSLTKKLLDADGTYARLQPNVRTTSATADLLVNQLTVGTLDAVIVSEANVAMNRDKLDVVRIPGATAIQPYAIGKQTPYRQLAGRLLEALTSDASRKHYESLGFIWHAGDAAK